MPIVWVDTREHRRGCGALVGPGDVSQNEVGVGQQRVIVSNELVVYVARSADRRLRPPVNVQLATSSNLTIDVAHERREQCLVSVHDNHTHNRLQSAAGLRTGSVGKFKPNGT